MDTETALGNRVLWIDILKGIGILAVVWGHFTSDRFVCVFHMPLFFIVSGFLQKPRDTWKCLRYSFLRLMVPYFAFLLMLFLLESLRCGYPLQPYLLLWGGKSLTGIFGVFWFITVLFLSKNLFNVFLRRNWLAPWIFLFFAALAYVVEYTGIQLVWGAEIVPAALFFLWVGNRSALLFSRFLRWLGVPWIRVVFGITVFCFLLIAWFFQESLYIDMKYSRLGIPVLSICLAIGITWGIAAMSIFLERWKCLASGLTYIGKASMSVMFLHLPVFYLLIENQPVYIVFPLTVALCLLVDGLFRCNRFTRLVFLGA